MASPVEASRRPDLPDIVTVTANPAIDVYVRAEVLTPGALHRTDEQIMVPGGKGLNVSRALEAMGRPSLALGFAGGMRGRWLASALPEWAQWVPIEGETRLNLKILERDGRLTELNGPSPEIDEACWERLTDEIVRAVRPGTWVVIAGNLPAGCPEDGYRRWMEAATGRGAKVALDASGQALRLAVEARPALVKPNLAELAEWAGEPITCLEDVARHARRMAELASCVVVSLGPEGAIAATQAGMWRARVPRVKVVSPVGAGDSLVAAMVHALSSGIEMPDALAFACAAATYKVQLSPGEFPTQRQVEALQAQVHIEAWRDVLWPSS
ncbi:1-phosphofructokinase family hexose kinase [Alicyclobacillus vulcanalis]|uniref:Tagatose-6-phosphate kinase n=1 Tax=Alicyclobacillus vulcanalis TaxID=252246 RepID=A0A1N7M2X5_9BACL|nr:1-phosphofructokinase family hexose kinase [Alicyclobacillus vulcanalis]SIS80428.1 1-phosphofructokinase [Alicyclobacillus vulcanalis]